MRHGSREKSGGVITRQATHPAPIRHPRSVAVKQSPGHTRPRPIPIIIPNDQGELVG